MSDKTAIAAAEAHQAIMDMASAFRESGREDERERIIALLKSASAYDRLKRNGEPTAMLDATIALIKGENK